MKLMGSGGARPSVQLQIERGKKAVGLMERLVTDLGQMAGAHNPPMPYLDPEAERGLKVAIRPLLEDGFTYRLEWGEQLSTNAWGLEEGTTIRVEMRLSNRSRPIDRFGRPLPEENDHWKIRAWLDPNADRVETVRIERDMEAGGAVA